jgi:prepilin-type N-terminal cleavage/methylation domain-containing protein
MCLSISRDLGGLVMHRNTLIRRGFTMIELLVVITVITLMMSLLIGASYRFIVGARESATATTVMKANGLIQDRVRAFHEFDFTDAAINYQNAYSSSDVVLAEIIIRKILFKKAFPQCFVDLDALQTTRFFGGATIPPTGLYQPKFESGIVLYALLTKGDTFGAASPGEDTFTGAEVRVSAETGNLPCLVDAWGEPIRFYRWPTRLIRCAEQSFDGVGTYNDYNQNGQQDSGGFGSAAIRPYSLFPGPTPASVLIGSLPPFERTGSYALGSDTHPGVAFSDDDGNMTVDDAGEIGWPDSDDPELLNNDPDDPTYRLTVLGTSTTASTARTKFITNFHDPFTFHTPLIVSAGPDKRLGLYEPADVANIGYLAAPINAPAGSTAAKTTMQDLFDDISNLNQRAGGK